MSRQDIQSPVIVQEMSLDEMRTLVGGEPGTVYAVLDACDEPRVPPQVNAWGPERAVSLYRGSAEYEYWAIAPYLVSVDDAALEWIIETLWDEPWGIFVITTDDLATVRKQLRRFLTVKDPEGNEVFFRFYDPRVLPTFLTTCTPHEAGQFFGPIERFCSKSAQGGVTTFQQVMGNSDV